jgi:HTH-type transcriptional regulator / antitoxin HipB
MRVRTPAELGAAIRERRKTLNIDQQMLATQIGVSRQWVVEIEKGKPRAEIGLLLRAISALGLCIDVDTQDAPFVVPGEEGELPAFLDIDIDEVIDRARGLIP